VSKKWYEYFVVAAPREGAAQDEVDAATPPRARDLVPDAGGDATFTTPVTPGADFSDIYTSAQIATPGHGYTVLKVAEMLQSEHIRALPAEVKQKSIMVALEAAGVKVEQIVDDAVQRDRALDTYERVLQKHLEGLRTQHAEENRRLEDEINQRVAELRARIDANLADVRREEQELATWQTRKRVEEHRIAEAVGHFVSPNPITTSAAAVKDKGESDVR
jgi:Asp-tRNA(Asn)/Glu-tRNA(Gln) amidotransferase A subunit family amidase